MSSDSTKLGRPCLVCANQTLKKKVNALLATGEESYVDIAREFGFSRGSVQRHHQKHCASYVAGAPSPANVRNKPTKLSTSINEDDFAAWDAETRLDTPEAVLLYGKKVMFRIEMLLRQGEAEGDWRLVDSGLKTQVAHLKDFFAKATRLIDERPVNVTNLTKIEVALKDYSLEDLHRWLAVGGTEPPKALES